MKVNVTAKNFDAFRTALNNRHITTFSQRHEKPEKDITSWFVEGYQVLLYDKISGRPAGSAYTTFCFFKNNVLIFVCDDDLVFSRYTGGFSNTVKRLIKTHPDALLVAFGQEEILLENGDESYFGDNERQRAKSRMTGCSSVTISFQCLMRFLKEDDYENLKRLVAKRKIKVFDFTEDSTLVVKKGTRPLKDPRRKPPKPGYTLIVLDGKSVWHRAGSVLLEVTYKQTKNLLLFGVDDSTYYGTQLPGKALTINKAYEILTPPAARKGFSERQGEWFAVPVKKSKIPDVNKCLAIIDNGTANLPIPDQNSKLHVVNAEQIRIAAEGFFAMNPSVEHDDHPELIVEGWCQFHRNTAVRSFSQEGVD